MKYILSNDSLIKLFIFLCKENKYILAEPEALWINIFMENTYILAETEALWIIIFFKNVYFEIAEIGHVHVAPQYAVVQLTQLQ